LAAAHFYHTVAALYHEDAMGQLNIKDEALIAEAKALARRWEPASRACCARACGPRAERQRRDEAEREAFVRDIMAIADEASKLFPPHLRTSDHSDLYDEHGAPA
jgi:hypothetical protein